MKMKRLTIAHAQMTGRPGYPPENQMGSPIPCQCHRDRLLDDSVDKSVQPHRPLVDSY